MGVGLGCVYAIYTVLAVVKRAYWDLTAHVSQHHCNLCSACAHEVSLFRNHVLTRARNMQVTQILRIPFIKQTPRPAD